MNAPGTILPLLVFEAAGCLMAVPASEVAHLEARGSDPLFTKTVNQTGFDLGEYFTQQPSEGPWLHWTRGTRSAWLRVMRVIDVVPVALAGLTPMPSLLTAPQRTHAFLAAGVIGHEVFLLMDPARLTSDAVSAGRDAADRDSAGRCFSRATTP